MSYVVDFTSVSTIGLGSSPVAPALAGLRANEARYFKNKYGRDFTVQPASEARELAGTIRGSFCDQGRVLISAAIVGPGGPSNGVRRDGLARIRG
jgi:hypothetical protein